MTESRKTIIVLLAVAGALAILLAVLAISPKAQAYDPGKDQISIFSYNTAQVASVTLARGDNQRKILQIEGGWALADGTALDYDATDLLVTFIAYLYSDNLVEEHADSMAPYGLEPPSARASFTLIDGTSHTIDFGGMTPNGKSVFMRVDGSDTVYSVPFDVYSIIFADV
ncbi:MAG: DUF4340 domain-containing protein [Christensenellales bacterium]|jgi:hypothetical protein